MPAYYKTEDKALRRIEILKRHGIWPGLIKRADRRYQLTYNPRETYEMR